MTLRLSAFVLASLTTVLAAQQSPRQTSGAQKRAEPPKSESAELAALAQKVLGKDCTNKLFYFPTHDEPATPKKWGYDYENINFRSGDGTALHGWFIPSAKRSSKGTIVFSHGNTGSMGWHLGFILWLVEAGYNVMMYDYRGFGTSGGEVNRRGMIDDVKACFSYVKKRSDVDPQRLVSFGHSLGGSQSITALGESPVNGLRAIIIDGAFNSYNAMAKIIAGDLGGNLITDELSPRDFIKKIGPVPLLVVHGTSDEVVPLSQGVQLFRRALGPKTMFEVTGGQHGDSLSRNNGEYRKKLLTWLEAVLKS